MAAHIRFAPLIGASDAATIVQSQENLAPPTLITTPTSSEVFHSRPQNDDAGCCRLGSSTARSRFTGVPIAMKWECEGSVREGDLAASCAARCVCGVPASSSCQEDACLTTSCRPLRLQCVSSPGCLSIHRSSLPEPSRVYRGPASSARSRTGPLCFRVCLRPLRRFRYSLLVVVLACPRRGEGGQGDRAPSCLHIGL